MDNLTDKLMVNFQVTRSQRHAFKLACLKLGTTMSAVLRDAVTETITIASLMPDSGRLPREGNADV